MSSPDATPAADGAPRRAWLAPGFLLVGALVLLRTSALYEIATGFRGVEPDIARWAAGAQLGATIVQSCVLGLSAAALIFLGRRSLRRLGVASLLALGLLVLALIRPGELAFEVLTGESFGNELMLLAVPIALALVAASATLAEILRHTPRAERLLASWPSLALAALLGLGLAPGQAWRATSSTVGIQVREVVAELALAPERLTTVAADAEHPPGLGVLTPLVNFEVDAADKPALVMPPPCTVELEVLPDETDVRLHAAAGVDLATANLVPQAGQLRVRFEVLVDDQPAFDEVVVVRHPDHAWARGPEGEAAAQAHAWRHLGEGAGLALEPGQRVTLRTSLPDYEGKEYPEPARGLALGFGGLTLERSPSRARELATPDQPNVVLIVMDTLRADRCSCYGYPLPTTPNLDALAARGLLFENAFSASSWTWPATASILTGLLPDEHGVVSNESSTLFLGYETIAETLQRRGYTTAAITCNNLIADERLFDQGFERFDDDPRPRKTDVVFDDVRATLAGIADARFFLYLHLMDPHTPHEPLDHQRTRLGIGERPADYPDRREGDRVSDGMDEYAKRLNKGEGRDADGTPHPERVIPPEHLTWMNAAYDASVATGDFWLGEVVYLIEQLGLGDNTVIAFTSDHGEELLDHDGLAHGHTLHRELLHVPLVLAGPGIPIRERVETPVSNRHLAPTLALIGGTRLEGPTDAQNLLAASSLGGPLFAATEKGLWNGTPRQRLSALRDGEFVLHENATADERRLYETSLDPTEQDDLARRPGSEQRVGEMARELERWFAEQQQRRQGSALGMGAGALDALKGIGYVGDDPEEGDER